MLLYHVPQAEVDLKNIPAHQALVYLTPSLFLESLKGFNHPGELPSSFIRAREEAT